MSNPVRQTKGSMLADLTASEDKHLRPGEIVLIPTGWFPNQRKEQVLSPCLGYLIFARSSLAKRGLTLANGVGVIDVDYPDEVLVILKNNTDSTITILKDERIAQVGLFASVPFFPCLDNERTGGFGSTGAT